MHCTETSDPKLWGDRVRRRRLELGITQPEAAVQIGVDRVTFRHWEANLYTPEVSYLPRIIDFLGYCPLFPLSTLGDTVAALRALLGLTIVELGELTGAGKSTVARWEENQSRPLPPLSARLQRIVEYVGLPWRPEFVSHQR